MDELYKPQDNKSEVKEAELNFSDGFKNALELANREELLRLVLGGNLSSLNLRYYIEEKEEKEVILKSERRKEDQKEFLNLVNRAITQLNKSLETIIKKLNTEVGGKSNNNIDEFNSFNKLMSEMHDVSNRKFNELKSGVKLPMRQKHEKIQIIYEKGKVKIYYTDFDNNYMFVWDYEKKDFIKLS